MAKQADNRSIAARMLKVGDRVVHGFAGPATVTKIRKRDGAVFIKSDDGIEGACDARLLSRAVETSQTA